MTALLTRTRLLTTVDQTPGLWIVEACAGSGKTEFARQLARHYGSSVVPAVSIEAAAQCGTIIVDVRGSWEPTANELASLRERGSGEVTIIMARRLSVAARELGLELGARWLRAADLWFDDDELVEFAESSLTGQGGRRLGRSLRSLTDGWPAAVDACVVESQRASSQGGDFGTAASAAFAAALSPILDELPSIEVSRLEVLSFFERFDASMAEALDRPLLVPVLTDAGVPLLDDGRWQSLGSVARSFIRGRLRKLPDVDQKLFDIVAERGHVIEAAEAATELGRPDLAVEIVAGLGADGAHGLNADRSGALFTRLGTTLDRNPRTHLVRARQVLGTGNITATIDILRHGLTVVHEMSGLDSVAEELQAELAFALYLSGDLDASRQQLPDHDFALGTARARQYQVIAGLDALTMRREALERASERYRIAGKLWADNGDPAEAGVTLARLAMEATSRLGFLGEALALLDQNFSSSAAMPQRRASTQLLRVRLLALAGRHDQAEALLREVDGLVGIVLRSWMGAHTHQARMLMASHRGDGDEVARLFKLAGDALGDLNQHAPGAFLHADAVDAFARCGFSERVADHLVALRTHPNAEPPDILWAEIVAACRVHDALLGLELAADFKAGDIAVPGGEWKLALMESVALRRLGRDDEARSRSAQARNMAASVGTPDIIEATESSSRPAQDAVTPRARVSIRVFPTFSVEVDGSPVDLPRGHTRTILKLLVLRDGYMMVDEVVEAIWPNGDPNLGRRRIRNVTSRLRALCGDVVLRNSGELRLADDVERPFAEWWNQSVAVLSGEASAASTLEALVAMAPNVLLPTDRYEEWLQPLQIRYQVQLLRLLDRAATDAAAQGNIDRAVAAYRRGLDIDPWASERIDAAISLLDEAGRPAEVRSFERLRIKD